MASFSMRTGRRRPLPDRTRVEEAPEDLRLVLQKVLVAEKGWVGAYRLLSEALHRVPDSHIWGDSFAAGPVREIIADELEWFEVFDLLEEYAPADEVNASFARTGLAYEMTSTRHGSEIRPLDPSGERFDIRGVESVAGDVLSGRFDPVTEQWDRALRALRGRPSDPEKAIGEAMGALEAVVRILGGGQDFGANVNAIFMNEPDWAKALARSLKALYGYTSQVPGARHGRYADPSIEQAEANYVVRVCGVAIAYLIDGERAGRWG